MAGWPKTVSEFMELYPELPPPGDLITFDPYEIPEVPLMAVDFDPEPDDGWHDVTFSHDRRTGESVLTHCYPDGSIFSWFRKVIK